MGDEAVQISEAAKPDSDSIIQKLFRFTSVGYPILSINKEGVRAFTNTLGTGGIIKNARYKLQLKAESLSRKVPDNPTNSSISAAKKAGIQRDLVKEDQFKPERTKLDQVLYTLINKNPDFHTFCGSLDSLKEKLSDDQGSDSTVERDPPIDRTMETWLYNILLDRTRLLDKLRP